MLPQDSGTLWRLSKRGVAGGECARPSDSAAETKWEREACAMGSRQVEVEERVSRGNVLVRFRDDEIVEGAASGLDLDRPEFSIEISGDSTNSRAAVVPLASIKSVVLERHGFGAGAPASTRLRKVVIHFWDGEVLKGLVDAEPVRHSHGMTVSLVSPGL